MTARVLWSGRRPQPTDRDRRSDQAGHLVEHYPASAAAEPVAFRGTLVALSTVDRQGGRGQSYPSTRHASEARDNPTSAPAVHHRCLPAASECTHPEIHGGGTSWPENQMANTQIIVGVGLAPQWAEPYRRPGSDPGHALQRARLPRRRPAAPPHLPGPGVAGPAGPPRRPGVWHRRAGAADARAQRPHRFANAPIEVPRPQWGRALSARRTAYAVLRAEHATVDRLLGSAPLPAQTSMRSWASRGK